MFSLCTKGLLAQGAMQIFSASLQFVIDRCVLQREILEPQVVTHRANSESRRPRPTWCVLATWFALLGLGVSSNSFCLGSWGTLGSGRAAQWMMMLAPLCQLLAPSRHRARVRRRRRTTCSHPCVGAMQIFSADSMRTFRTCTSELAEMRLSSTAATRRVGAYAKGLSQTCYGTFLAKRYVGHEFNAQHIFSQTYVSGTSCRLAISRFGA